MPPYNIQEKTFIMSNILLIDDERAIRKTITDILSFEGYKIKEAADGEEGLKDVFRKKYLM